MLSQLCGIKQIVVDFFTGIFAFIPQCMYFFYACMASFLDLLQALIRKLAGLDSYYVTNSDEPISGDILERFVKSILGIDGSYSAVSTVFWSLIIFGSIVLVISVIIALIKAHYSYDESKSNPKEPLVKALKSIGTMVIVPIVTVFGIGISNLLLNTLDKITSSSGSQNVEETFENSDVNVSSAFVSGKDEWGNVTYVSFDMFGLHIKTGYQTFSGLLFKVAARSANRVRSTSFTASEAGDSWSNAGVFKSTLSDTSAQIEDVATQIDFAFANNLELSSGQTLSVLKKESSVLIPSYRYFTSAIWYLATINFTHFSKYHVGLVWYFYNLWSFNFIIGYIGVILALTFLTNIVFGLITRLFEATALFLVLPPIVAISPLDDERAFGTWRGEFVGDVLMGYGAVIGINLLFLLLPFLQRITFFRSDMLNNIINMVVVIVALIGAKQLVEIMSNLIGGKDAVAAGADTKKAVGETAKKMAEKGAAAAMLAVKFAKFIPAVSAAAKAIDKAATKIKKKIVDKIRAAQQAKLQKLADKEAKKGRLNMFERARKQQLQDRIDQLDGKTKEPNKLEQERKDEEARKADLEKKKAEREMEASKQDEQAADEDAAAQDEENAAQNEDAAAQAEDAAAQNAENNEPDRESEANTNMTADFLQNQRGLDNMKDEDRQVMEAAANAYNDNIAQRQADLGRELNDDEKRDIATQAASLANQDLSRDAFAQMHRTQASEHRDQAAEHRSQASDHREAADAHRQNAAAQRELAAEADQQIAEINRRISKGGDLSDEEIEKSKAEQRAQEAADRREDTVQAIIKFGGETLRTVGGVFGLDELKDKLDKETSTLDYGRTMLKDFALVMQVKNVDKMKPFQTKKERADAKRAKLQAKAVVETGKRESYEMARATDRLVREFNSYKRIIEANEKIDELNKKKNS